MSLTSTTPTVPHPLMLALQNAHVEFETNRKKQVDEEKRKEEQVGVVGEPRMLG